MPGKLGSPAALLATFCLGKGQVTGQIELWLSNRSLCSVLLKHQVFNLVEKKREKKTHSRNNSLSLLSSPL